MVALLNLLIKGNHKGLPRRKGNHKGLPLLILLSTNLCAASYPGLPSRDQNPLLIPYYIPTVFSSDQQGWSYSHDLFITNTLQEEKKSEEILTIDAESLRYDLNLAYQQQDWLFTLQLPYISHNTGELDSLIENWHDFFQLPEGGRKSNPNNRLNIDYQRDGEQVFSLQQSTSGLADIKIAAAYQFSKNTKQNTQIWLGVDLPTAESSSQLGNDGLDLAVWISHNRNLNSQLNVYGMMGLSLIDDSGPLKGEVNSVIGFAQGGLNYQFTDRYGVLLQADMHSAAVKNTRLKALDHSLQMQFGLVIKNLVPEHQMTLFFSEDVLVGSAPDITFGLELRMAIDR